MKILLAVVALMAVSGCAGSPIGGKYGLGKNEAGYAEEARVRQETRNRLAARRAEFNYYCMAPVERTPALYQWCVMRQYELSREEDRNERQEDREDQKEREFQSWRRERLKPEPKRSIDCTSSSYGGSTTTHCD